MQIEQPQEILISVEVVQLKKITAALTVTRQHVQFGSDVKLTISDIKGQSFSPATAAKVSLKLTMSDDSSYIFRFLGSADTASSSSALDEQGIKEKALQERDMVKDCITELVNAHRSQISASQPSSRPGTPAVIGETVAPAVPLSPEEIKARQMLLAKDAVLRKMHRELVLMAHLTEEEFWTTRRVGSPCCIVEFIICMIACTGCTNEAESTQSRPLFHHGPRYPTSDNNQVRWQCRKCQIYPDAADYSSHFLASPQKCVGIHDDILENFPIIVKQVYIENVPDKVVDYLAIMMRLCL